MTNEEVREHVQGNDMQSLWEADQVHSLLPLRHTQPLLIRILSSCS
jgi:hypothetical protein